MVAFLAAPAIGRRFNWLVRRQPCYGSFAMGCRMEAACIVSSLLRNHLLTFRPEPTPHGDAQFSYHLRFSAGSDLAAGKPAPYRRKASPRKSRVLRLASQPRDRFKTDKVHHVIPFTYYPRIERRKMTALDEMTLEELREDVEYKTFAVQSLIGQRQRLLTLMELIANADGLGAEQIQNVMRSAQETQSQFKQEAFALAMAKGKRNGYFVEFGACDGLHLSNTSVLEKMFDWQGILAEPAVSWHAGLEAGRSAIIDLRCVTSETGQMIAFQEAAQLGQSAATKAGPRKLSQGVKKYSVETVSLMDLLQEHRAPTEIDFLSIDTEGSEFEILSSFDFDKFKFGFISVEQHRDDHPVTGLLESVGYKVLYPRKPDLVNWSQVTGFDSWYVPN